jgi:hypothetical protein
MTSSHFVPWKIQPYHDTATMTSGVRNAMIGCNTWAIAVLMESSQEIGQHEWHAEAVPCKLGW